MAACCGCKSPYNTMAECRQQVWTRIIGKYTRAPRLCSLPSPLEAFHQNVLRAHVQLAQWHSALTGQPPALSALDDEWGSDDINKCLYLRNIIDWVPYAPKEALKLVKWGCKSERPCKGGNCGCIGRLLPCTRFCS